MTVNDLLADPEDVGDRWRPLLDSEYPKVVALLGDASALIRAEFPGIDDAIAAGDPSADVVAGVVANMVKRTLLQAEDGISSESESTGPFSHSRQFANPLGNLFLTAAERVLILGRRPKAMSVQYG